MIPLPSAAALRVIAIGVLVAALAGLGWYAKGVLDERNELRVQNAALEADLSAERQIEKTTSVVLSARTASAAAIQKESASVQADIASRRPGAECRLPLDWRVLHDTAAGAVPATPGGADEASSAAAGPAR